MSTEIFSDEKIIFLRDMPNGDSLLTLWIFLLVLAGKINDNGYIYFKHNVPYTAQMLSLISHIPQSTVELGLKTMKDFEMIDIDSNGMIILNWEKHQNIKGLEKIREQTKLRTRKYRERLKELPSGNNSPNNSSNPEQCDASQYVTVTHLDIDKDIDKELDIYIGAPAIEKVVLLWNQFEISRIPANREKTNAAILKALSDHGEEAVLQAIRNYFSVLSDKESILSTKWMLSIFMESHIEKFLDIENARNMYKAKGGTNGSGLERKAEQDAWKEKFKNPAGTHTDERDIEKLVVRPKGSN